MITIRPGFSAEPLYRLRGHVFASSSTSQEFSSSLTTSEEAIRADLSLLGVSPRGIGQCPSPAAGEPVDEKSLERPVVAPRPRAGDLLPTSVDARESIVAGDHGRILHLQPLLRECQVDCHRETQRDKKTPWRFFPAPPPPEFFLSFF